MKLSQFKFNLPTELIAQYPAEQLHTPEHPSYRRDECRLMVGHRKTGEVERFKRDNDGNPIEGQFLDFRNIIDYFDEHDLFVLNDTKVFPARLFGNKEKTGAQIEVFLLRELNRDMHYWDVLVEPARKIRIGNKLYFSDDDTLVAEVIDNTTSRGRTLRFLYDNDYEAFRKRLFELGQTPLPREVFSRPAEPEDEERYQTIYAQKEGAVAAPAAGLHFSRELFKRMEIRGIDVEFLTSHIGLGNFKRIDVEDLTKHKMGSEQMFISDQLVDRIEYAHEHQQRVLAVGTDVMRALESVVGTDGHIKSYDGWTNKFIFPPYDFTVANAMLANFYLPYSSMLMLTAAFGGYDTIMQAYEQAVADGNPQHIAEASDLIDNAHAWDYEAQFKRILTMLKITDLNQPVDSLSGGQAKRVALAQVLLDEPQLLLLDEPTNHLDIEMIEWLENHLRRSSSALLMVTHDRYFLDNICSRIIEIDQHHIYSYDGNYNYYLGKRAERLEAEAAAVERARNLLRTELEWMRRQPQARAHKAQYRIDAFYDLRDRTRTQRNERDLELRTGAATYIGNKIFEARQVCHSFGDKVILDNFTYTFARSASYFESGIGRGMLL